MEDARSSLQATFEQMLRDYGLDNLQYPPGHGEEGFEAMWNSGLWADAAPGLSKEEAREKMIRLRSESASHVYDPVVQELARAVENDIAATGARLPCTVYAGSMPLGYANGYALQTKDGALVILNYGLLHLMYQIVKIFVWSCDWIRIEVKGLDPEKTLSDNFGWEGERWTMERSIEAVVQVYVAYAKTGSATLAPRQAIPRGERAVWMSWLDRYAEHFLMAHEYAHVLNEDSGPRMVVQTPFGPLKDVMQRNRQQEHDADVAAISLMVRACDLTNDDGVDDARYRVGGAAVLFASSLFLEGIRNGPSAVQLIPSDYATHPTPLARIKEIIELIHDRYGNTGRQMTNIARVVELWAKHLVAPVAIRFEELRRQAGEAFKYL